MNNNNNINRDENDDEQKNIEEYNKAKLEAVEEKEKELKATNNNSGNDINMIQNENR